MYPLQTSIGCCIQRHGINQLIGLNGVVGYRVREIYFPNYFQAPLKCGHGVCRDFGCRQWVPIVATQTALTPLNHCGSRMRESK